MIFSYVDRVICSYRVRCMHLTWEGPSNRGDSSSIPFALCSDIVFTGKRDPGHKRTYRDTNTQTTDIQTDSPKHTNKCKCLCYGEPSVTFSLTSSTISASLDLTQNVLEPLSRSWRHPGRCTFAERRIPKRICHIRPTWISLGNDLGTRLEGLHLTFQLSRAARQNASERVTKTKNYFSCKGLASSQNISHLKCLDTMEGKLRRGG